MHLPQSFIENIKDAPGFNEATFIEAHTNIQNITSVRLNPFKPSAKMSLPVGADVPWCSNGKYLTHRPSFTQDPLLHAGAYYVQEASSMFVWHAMETITQSSNGNLKILDLCAAPGGKSTLLASFNKDNLVVSNEVIKTRANILTENLSKWGLENVVVTSNDAKDFAKLPDFFDIVLVDAPCSGSGLFRKDKHAIEEWSTDNVALCSQRQQRILADVLPTIAPGGYLIYSTCSYAVAEDENIATWLVEELDFLSVNLAPPVEWNIVETTTINGAKGYRFYPDKIKGEGFFLAVFKRNGDAVPFVNKPLKGLPLANKTDRGITAKWLKENDGIELLTFDKKLLAFPKKYQHEVSLLQKSLYLRKVGVTVGEIKGKDLVPHHELAVSILCNNGIQSVELTKEQALNYLKKREFEIDTELRGWVKMNYSGFGLGWCKILPNRMNNYYPMEWRILRD